MNIGKVIQNVLHEFYGRFFIYYVDSYDSFFNFFDIFYDFYSVFYIFYFVSYSVRYEIYFVSVGISRLSKNLLRILVEYRFQENVLSDNNVYPYFNIYVVSYSRLKSYFQVQRSERVWF